MLQPMSSYARLFTFVAAIGAAGFLHACKTGNNSAIKAADSAAATTGRGEQCGSLSPKEGYTIQPLQRLSQLWISRRDDIRRLRS
jgi:hypothetical protein